MQTRGINYDTGFSPAGSSSRERFDPDVVREEMRVIADELHCSAVRISGGDVGRLTVAATHAAAAGLEVWFAPFPCELAREEMLALFVECAERAEELRRGGAAVVLVTGCEISAFGEGFLPGEDTMKRLDRLSNGGPEVWEQIGPVIVALNAFLAEVVAAVRPVFGGRISYASAPWEFVDWSPFDVVGVDAYRAAYNAATYREELREHLKHGKPVVATEFGTCAYVGAGERGGMAWAVREGDGVVEGLVRDEGEQVRYLKELLDAFEQEGLDGAFWFTFATYQAPHRSDPRRDLDLAAYGVVKMLDETRWEPKAVFNAMAERFSRT